MEPKIILNFGIYRSKTNSKTQTDMCHLTTVVTQDPPSVIYRILKEQYKKSLHAPKHVQILAGTTKTGVSLTLAVK